MCDHGRSQGCDGCAVLIYIMFIPYVLVYFFVHIHFCIIIYIKATLLYTCKISFTSYVYPTGFGRKGPHIHSATLQLPGASVAGSICCREHLLLGEPVAGSIYTLPGSSTVAGGRCRCRGSAKQVTSCPANLRRRDLLVREAQKERGPLESLPS